MIARLRPARSRRYADARPTTSSSTTTASTSPRADVFKRDPVNLIRLFHLAQKHNLAIPSRSACARPTRSLKLIDAKAARGRGSEPAVPRDPDLEERGRDRAAAHERGRRARRVRARLRPHRGDDAVQHVPPLYGGRASAALHRRAQRDRARRAIRDVRARQRTDPAPSSREHRKVLYVALFLHDIAKGRVEDHSIAGARIARRFCPRLGFSAAETELVAWLVEVHLVMSTVAQSRDLSDRKTIENFAAVVQSLERMKLLTILTTADIRAVGPGVWNGWKAQLLRTLYYETEPVLTGGFSEVNRAERVAHGEGRIPRRRSAIGRHDDARRLHRAPLSGLLAQGRSAAQDRACALRARRRGGRQAARHQRRLRRRARRHRADRVRARPSVAAVDHRRRLRARRRQHRRRPDLHHDRRARARHHRGLARVRARRGRGAPRRAHRRRHREGGARRDQAARSGGRSARRRKGASRLSPSSPR